MDRPAGTLAAHLALGLVTIGVVACGDPVFVAGDLPGLMRIVAGEPDSPGTKLDSLATRSQLTNPMGVTFSADGVLYIADRSNARILAVSSSGQIEVLLDHSKSSDPSRVRSPTGIALDGRGDLLVADPDAGRVWKLMLGDKSLSVIAGTGELGASPDGTLALEADLGKPFGVAVRQDGGIYFSERSGHRVRRIEPAGSLTTVAGTGDPLFGGDGGAATEARFDQPAGLAIVDDLLYIADSSNDRIRVVELATGIVRTVAGNGVRAFGGDGELAVDAQLNQPLFVAVTADRATLFISDTNNHRVRAVDLPSGAISTFAGTGDQQFTGDLQDAGATSLRFPGGLATSSFDLLHIADTGHDIVWRVAVRF